MVDYARSINERPLHLTAQGNLTYLPEGQDVEDAYEGISFQQGSGHEVWQQLIKQVQKQAQEAGIFDNNTVEDLTTWAFCEGSEKQSRKQWQSWGDARNLPWSFSGLHPDYTETSA